MRSRALRPLLNAGLGAWLTAVVVIAVSRATGGGPGLGGLSATPDLLLDGRLDTLLTSALPTGRLPFAEIAGLLAAVYAVWRLAGVATVWIVGLTAHIGCTLIVYAGIGALWLADHSAADPYTDRRDYGISAVWLGELGFLSAALWPRNRRAALGVGLGSLAGSLVVASATGAMATAEHLVALGLGVLVPKIFPALLRPTPS